MDTIGELLRPQAIPVAGCPPRREATRTFA